VHILGIHAFRQSCVTGNVCEHDRSMATSAQEALNACAFRRGRGQWLFAEQITTHAAKSAFQRDEVIAAGTPKRESGPAIGAKLAARGVLVLAPWAVHHRSSNGYLRSPVRMIRELRAGKCNVLGDVLKAAVTFSRSALMIQLKKCE
jgi:hypothetical protein